MKPGSWIALIALIFTVAAFSIEPNTERLTGTEIGNTSDPIRGETGGRGEGTEIGNHSGDSLEGLVPALMGVYGELKLVDNVTTKLDVPGSRAAVHFVSRTYAYTAAKFLSEMTKRGWKKLGMESHLGFFIRKPTFGGVLRTNLEVFKPGEKSNQIISIRVENARNSGLTIEELEEFERVLAQID